MNYTLLELVQQVTGELGVSRPTLVIGNNDPQIIQLLALVNRLGRGKHNTPYRVTGADKYPRRSGIERHNGRS